MAATLAALLAISGCGASDAAAQDDGGAPPDMAIAPQCTSASECAAPERPICSPDSLCVACQQDVECLGIDPTAPLCAADGACVGCRGATDCTIASQPICDSGTRSCRACAQDAECESGVCDLNEGTCFAASDVYVVDDGAPCGSGDGSNAAPFCTIQEALGVAIAAPRNFISVRDGQYKFPALAAGPLPAFIGTAGAEITPASAGGDCLTLDTPARLQLRGFRFAACKTALKLGASANQVSVTNTIIDASQTGIDCKAKLCVVKGVHISGTKTGIRCTGGATSIMCNLTNLDVTGGDTGVASATTQLILHDSKITDSKLLGLDLSSSEVDVRRVTVRGIGVGGTGPTTAVACVASYCLFDRTRIVGSRGAGLVIANSPFEIYSSAILGNGSDDATLAQNGGVVLLAPGATRTFQNNTVAGNRAAAGAVAGVRCGAAVTLRSSIVWGNTGTPLEAACAAEYSDIDTAAGAQPGTGNIRLDPKLASVTPGAMDEHIAADSPCIDTGDPAGGPVDDIDGEARPAGVRVDMGADETPR